MSHWFWTARSASTAAFLAAAIAGWNAAGQTESERPKAFIAYPAVSEAVFESVAEVATPKTGSASTFVANPFKTSEKPAELGEWPASFFFTWTNGDGSRDMCSATLIGPQTFATATHCLPPGAPVSIKLGGNIIRAIGCVSADGFGVPTSDSDMDRCQQGEACPASHDVSLCLLESAAIVTTLETVATASDALKRDLPVMITGFGCTRRDATGGTPSGNVVFSLGWASLSRLPVPEKNNYYALTSATLPIQPPVPDGPKATGSDICPGDSGGGTYLSGLNPQNRDWRRLLGVNSAVRRAPDRRTVTGPSFIVPLSSAPAAALVSGWADKTLMKMKSWPKDKLAASDTSICGLRAEQTPLCRQ